MRYLVMSLPAMSNLRVRCGRAKPSYTGHIWVTPSPESITTPVSKPYRGKKQNKLFDALVITLKIFRSPKILN